MKLKELGEIKLIERLARRTRVDKTVVKGIGDDTAVIRWTKEKYLLFTCDMLVEDVHFTLKKATPFQVGWKALGRNISDIAAMGGIPKYALISVGLNPDQTVKFSDEIYRGLQAIAKKFGVSIVGGDTVTSDKLVIDVSLIGEVEKRNVVLRSGARIGDVVLVTGSIGGSIHGKHLNFVPRIAEARTLVTRSKIHSMIDISDGLFLDLKRILKLSNVGAKIYRDSIPLSGNARSFESAVNDGEDFELLFTMSPVDAKKFFKLHAGKSKIPVTAIGEIVRAKEGFTLVDSDGCTKRITEKGYQHLA